MSVNTKRLKSTTIVPNELYIERGADRQLWTAVDEMGRPPYILVARQMGKTNLLLNLRRKLASVGNLGAYFDLTNQFDVARDFFRAIVDGITSLEPDTFQTTVREISELRSLKISGAHVEYERSLTLILRALENRKLVIIFDEIDSLIRVPFSDQILSHVRSVYFTRESQPEFWRLTYVLSGVVEPGDLIKNKEISPFNIGEKIFLDDFDKGEFSELVSRSILRLDQTTSDHFFDQVRGNPRMSWDVCSRLEDLQIAKGSVAIADIDATISEMYLRHFDRAPVDHMRTLVEEDPDLRSALVALRWGAVGSLDASKKSKLYLSGIASDADGSLSIKNPIIDHALSDEWLTTIDLKDDRILSDARSAFDASNYQDVVDLLGHERYRDVLVRNVRARFQLASSLFNIGKYDDASTHLTDLVEKANDQAFLDVAPFLLGICKQRLGQYEDSLPPLQKVVDNRGPSAQMALLAIMSSNVMLKRMADARDAGAAVLAWEGEHFDSAAVKATVHYNFGRIHQASREYPEARAEYVQSLEIAPDRLKVAIILQIREVLQLSEQRKRYAVAASDIVVEGRLKPLAISQMDLGFQHKHLHGLLDYLLEVRLFNELERVLEHARDVFGEANESGLSVMLRLANEFGGPGTSRSIQYLFTELRRDPSALSAGQALDVYRQMAISAAGGLRAEASKLFVDLALEELSRGHVPDEAATYFLLTQSAANLSAGKSAKSWPIIDAMLPAFAEPTLDNAMTVLLVRQHELVASSHDNRIEQAKRAAKVILDLISRKDELFVDLVADANLLGGIKSQAEETLRASRPIIPVDKKEITNISNIGRNDLVSVRNSETGAVETAKFKKVEEGIKSGQLTFEGKVRPARVISRGTRNTKR